MNPSGKRKDTASEILNSLRSDEGIVYATGNCGQCLGISNLAEPRFEKP